MLVSLGSPDSANKLLVDIRLTDADRIDCWPKEIVALPEVEESSGVCEVV
jgi:hypothetical protein